MIEVELPDGTVAEFPDDTPDDVIRGTLSQQFGAPAQAPAAPEPAAAQPVTGPRKSRRATRLEALSIGAADIVPGFRDIAAFALSDRFPGGRSEAKRAVDEAVRQTTSDRPVESIGGTLAASVATAPVAVGANALSTLGRTVALAGAQGAGVGDTAQERAKNALEAGATAGIFAGALQAAGTIGRAGADLVPGFRDRRGLGVQSLADKAGAKPEELKASIAEFRRVQGREPTLAEILNPGARRLVKEATARTDALNERANEVLRASEEAFSGRAASAVRRGADRPINVPATQRALKEAEDKAFAALRQTPVPLAEEELTFLNSPFIRNAFRRFASVQTDPDQQEILLRFADAADPAVRGELPPLTVGDFENLRLLLNKSAGDAPGEVALLREARARLQDSVAARVPAYGQVLQAGSEVRSRIDASVLGRKVASATGQGLDDVRGEAAAFAAGPAQEFQRSARESVAQRLEGSPSSAVGAANALARSTTGAQRLVAATGDAGEAERIAGQLRGELDALEGLRASVASTSREPTAQQTASEAALAASGAVSTTPRGAALAIAQLSNRIGISTRQAEAIVDLALTPGGASDAVEALVEAGVARQNARNLVNQIASTGGRAAAAETQ